jgi:D-glycero-D-manno-heptose 1,7-bisphosphate phosphatase
MANQCVFLDRDNTLIDDPGYLSDPSAVHLLPGVDRALKSLTDAGFRLVVVTNQSAVARGLVTEEGLERIHKELRRQLLERGIDLDAIYYCPFHPDGTVEEYARESMDRKPQPGMLLRAARELKIDLAHSWMVGDSARDVEAGQRAGCRTVMVRGLAVEQPEGAPARETKHMETLPDEGNQADFVVRNLVDAARVILREAGHGEGHVAEVAEAEEPAGPPRRPKPDRPVASALPPLERMSQEELLRELVRAQRDQGDGRRGGEFSAAMLVGSFFQILAILAMIWAAVHIQGVMPVDASPEAATGAYHHQAIVHLSLLAAGVMQAAALTFFFLARRPQ